jgi:hypothetical protein
MEVAIVVELIAVSPRIERAAVVVGVAAAPASPKRASSMTSRGRVAFIAVGRLGLRGSEVCGVL